jgi:hypothetical protein
MPLADNAAPGVGSKQKESKMIQLTQDQHDAPASNGQESAKAIDPVIEFYKKDLDRTLLRENLKLTIAGRFEKYEQFQKYAMELREAGRKARERR